MLQLVWMNPSVESHEIAWDYNMCTTQSADTEVRRLMAKAFKSALSLPQQEGLLGAIKKDPKLVYHIGGFSVYILLLTSISYHHVI